VLINIPPVHKARDSLRHLSANCPEISPQVQRISLGGSASAAPPRSPPL
jgi:hypothetical protein